MLKPTTTDAQPSHKHLRRNVASAIVSGCLALTLCPAIAFAAPGGNFQPQQGGEPTAMMQGGGDQGIPAGQGVPADQGASSEPGMAAGQDAPHGQNGSGGPSQEFGGPGDQGGTERPADQGGTEQPSDQGGDRLQGQAPDMQQPSNAGNGNQQPGQRPEDMGQQAGQPGGDGAQGGRDDETSGQVRSILSESYNVKASEPAQGQASGGRAPNGQAPDGSKPSEDAPSAPDGEVNVQQVIDSVRDMIRHYGFEVLGSADYADSEWASNATEYLAQANATRFTQTQTDQQQSADMQQDAIPDENTDANDSGQESASADKSLLSKLVSFVMGVFGQKA